MRAVPWAPNAPSHWSGAPLKWLARIYAGGTPSRDVPDYWEGGTIPWLNSGSVNDWIISEPSEFITEAGFESSSARWVPEGSVLMGLAGQGKTKGTAARLEMATTTNQSMAAIVPRPDLNYRFLHFWLTANYQSIRNLAGGDLRDGLNLQHVGSIEVPLPPMKEQLAIADYLDQEVASVNKLISAQHRLIEVLSERRSAAVDNVITSGLDPNAPLRDSGVAWLGHIPEHWDIRPLWTMYKRTKDVDHPEEQMLSVFRDFGVVPKDSRDNINQTAENRSIYQLVHPGWLVANRMKAWQGSVGISRYRGIVSGHYICFSPLHAEDDAYLNWLFRSTRYAAGYGQISRGVRTGQAEIDNDEYRVLPVLVPPIDEQKRISNHLNAQTARIDQLIAAATRLVDLALERRSALIAATVTGQIVLQGSAA